MLNFVKGSGLYDEFELICEFEPILCKTVKIYDEEGRSEKKYHLKVRYKDGSFSEVAVVSDLKKVDYGELFEVVDADLNAKEIKLLSAYLQGQNVNLEAKEEVFMAKTMGLCGKPPVAYIYDRHHTIAVNQSVTVNTDIAIPVLFKTVYTKEEMEAYLHRLIRLLPGVTDVMLAGELYAILKPIWELSPERSDMIELVYGPPGSYKTTLSKLIHVRVDTQVVTFVDARKNLLKERIRSLSGHSLLVDDYHGRGEKYYRDKQLAMLDMLARNTEGAHPVVTAEYMEGSFSLQDRFLQIPMEKLEGTDLEKFKTELTWLQQNVDILWAFYWQFAEWVYGNFEPMKQLMTELFKTKKIAVSGFRIDRNLKFLLVSMELVGKYFSSEVSSAWPDQINKSFQKIWNAQTAHMRNVEKVETGLDWAVEVYKVLANGLIGGVTPSPEKAFMDHDVVYVTGFLLQEKLAENLGMVKLKRAEIIDDLYEKDLLYLDKSKDRTIKRGGRRYYGIYWSQLAAYVKRYGGTENVPN